MIFHENLLIAILAFSSGPSSEEHVLKQSILLRISRPIVACLQTGARVHKKKLRAKVPG